jgi:hypothetical protein
MESRLPGELVAKKTDGRRCRLIYDSDRVTLLAQSFAALTGSNTVHSSENKWCRATRFRCCVISIEPIAEPGDKFISG